MEGPFDRTTAATTARVDAIGELAAALARLRGEAEAANGRVRASVRPGGALDSLEIDPRAMGLPPQELAAAIVASARAATAVAAERMTALEGARPGAGPIGAGGAPPPPRVA